MKNNLNHAPLLYQPRYAKPRRRRSSGWLLFMGILVGGILARFVYSPPEDPVMPVLTPDSQATDACPALPPEVSVFAREHGLTPAAYPPEILQLLERNPETLDFVRHYPLEHSDTPPENPELDLSTPGVPLLMQWDRRWGYLSYAGEPAGLSGCGPLCLSMVGLSLTGDSSRFAPLRVLEFARDNGYAVPGSGSAWDLIGDGAPRLGLEATELPLDRERIFRNLEVGNPIICVMGPGDFTTTGHFIVLTGTENGKISVNDPNSRANSRQLWDYDTLQAQIQNLWALRN